ncbi:hypothetical protein L1047_11310 [Synechococcus sp. Nb3U1]|uniref:hypothetical protein n=1 Tax=Synechococcus sp. Nb3U1 TaxID=1914529 RepID=UPI001F2620D4|nr:hypothetical protein [Synechococcus sp. Nb3U1]MCF2971783.1 hypothetical protein [Synechococcus sp. Nb3U1]
MSASYSPSAALTSSTSGLREYVTELQLHMALQARSLTPSLNLSPGHDSRLVMLQQAQADMEKSASRQWL